jgi:hypothetical protein
MATAALGVRQKSDRVDRARFAYLLRQATALPPRRLVAKAAGFAKRRALTAWQRRKDFVQGSHLPLERGLRWRNRVSIDAKEIAPDLHEPLRLLGDCYRRHRFDLLGSGWVEVRYGMTCAGFAGHAFPPCPTVVAQPDGDWLDGRVNGSNLAAARDLWRHIDDPSYRPIDWQLDFRSGYRWRADAHFSELTIPADIGADVKVPWELGRLQHLPQLALCAILAAAGAGGFAPAVEYVRELRCQLIDFLAVNPPRFGVNWMCPMDVGIRIANILLAIDLLIAVPGGAAGKLIDQDLVDIVMRSAREHADHIAAHLEWSERGRSNHYLANLVGLLWAAGHLPSDGRTDAMFAFAATELLQEGERQFGADGGNYEGSTNYHRLSGELVLFGVALLVGLSPDDLARLDAARPEALRVRAPWRAGPLRRYPLPDGGSTIVPPQLRDKLFCAGALTRAATRPDGGIVQIGDTDSGRLFKLTPVGRSEETRNGRVFREDALDHRALVAGVGALFGVADDARTVDSIVITRLAAGRSFPLPAPSRYGDHGDLDSVIAAIEALPAECHRRRHVKFAKPLPIQAWRRSAFPDFGLYTFAAGGAFIAFRCAPRPPPEAPLGHIHDDNLAVEYVLGEERRIDPGTLCYTPSRMLRDRYRGADAHDVVRARDWDVAASGPELFALDHVAWATCLAWQPHGAAGEVVAPRGRLLRALRLTESGLDILDGIEPPNCLRPVAPPIEIAIGYGELQSAPFGPQ